MPKPSQKPALPGYARAKVADLVPYARNSRQHSDAQVAAVAASIREFGFLNPVIVDGANGIIAGHCRVLAARLLGLDEVPVIEAAHLTEAQRRAYVIADNRLAEYGSSWDEAALAAEVFDLRDLGFDVSLAFPGLDDDEGSEADGAAPDMLWGAVTEIDFSDVHDRFYINIEGPLRSQMTVLEALKNALRDVPDVRVQQGLVQHE